MLKLHLLKLHHGMMVRIVTILSEKVRGSTTLLFQGRGGAAPAGGEEPLDWRVPGGLQAHPARQGGDIPGKTQYVLYISSITGYPVFSSAGYPSKSSLKWGCAAVQTEKDSIVELEAKFFLWTIFNQKVKGKRRYINLLHCNKYR